MAITKAADKQRRTVNTPVQLDKFISKHPTFAYILEYLKATRRRNIIDIDRVRTDLLDSGVDIALSEAIASFKELEQHGLGKVLNATKRGNHFRFQIGKGDSHILVRDLMGITQPRPFSKFTQAPAPVEGPVLSMPWGGSMLAVPLNGVTKSDVQMLIKMLESVSTKLS